MPVTLRRRDNANVVVSVHMVPWVVYGGEVVGVKARTRGGRWIGAAARAVEKQQTTHSVNWRPVLPTNSTSRCKNALYLANAESTQGSGVGPGCADWAGVDEQLNLDAEIIEHLRDFGRPIAPLENGFQLATVVERCLDLSRGNLVDRGIRLSYEKELAEELASGHPLQVEKPLIALLNNAREAITDGASGHPQIKVSLGRRGPDAAQIVALTMVRHCYRRMKRIFEPFTQRAMKAGILAWDWPCPAP